MNCVETDIGDHEGEFVGREHYLNELDKAFSKHKLFGIFGLRSVGKTRLVNEFIKRKCRSDRTSASEPKHGNTFELQYVVVDLRLHTNIDSLHTFMCSALGMTPKQNSTQSNQWKIQIQKEISKYNKQVFYVIFDNAEDAVERGIRDELLSLILMLVKQCNNLKIFVTSTTKVQFASYGRVFFDVELLPLPETEAALLLTNTAPAVDFGEEKEEIIKLSEGLPLLILMIGAEMRDQLTKPKEMVEMLAKFRLEALSKEFYPPEQRAGDVYRRFIERLSEMYQSRLAILGFIPGSFNTLEARELLDHKTDAIAKHDTLIPVRRRHMLNYDASTERFDIQGILRECLQVFFTIRNLPDVRHRYYKVFSKVMQELCRKLGTVEYTKALSELSLEHPNLIKLLTEVFNSNEENYNFFIEIATTCTSMIENYMSNVSDRFYQGCLSAAERYGRDIDKAIVHIAIGSLTTNSKGKFPIGEENYRSALQILKLHGKSLQLATVYQRLGWNLHSQGKSFESLSYYRKAMALSETSGYDYKPIFLQALSGYGVVSNWLGSYTEAEKCHFAVLKQRQELLGEHHPEVGETTNNIGLLYDQMGKPKTALKYFVKSLAIKRHNKGSTIYSKAISLNNVANKYTGFGWFDAAKDYLDEAMTILNGMETPHQGAISLTFNSYGKLYRAKGEYEKSSEMFERAVDMRQEIMPNSIAYVWSVIQFAQIKKQLHKYSTAMKLIGDILGNKEVPLKDMPHNDFVLHCLQIKADIYKTKGMMEQHKETLWDIKSELIRLEDEFMRMNNESKLEQTMKQLVELTLQIEN